MGTPLGHIAFSVSDNGVLGVRRGNWQPGCEPPVDMGEPAGQRSPGPLGAPEDIRGVDISPDGTRLATHQNTPAQGGDVWITDLSRGTTSRFTFDAAQHNASPIWSPGRRQHRLSARGAEARAVCIGSHRMEAAMRNADRASRRWSVRAGRPDGRSIVYNPIVSGTGPDMWMLPLAGDRKPSRSALRNTVR